ncbi:MAG: ComEC/Rec2 family competence protein [Minisyncoccia bacterium]
MFPHEIFFFGSLFFLVGVGLESLKLNFLILFLMAGCAAVFVLLGFWKKNRRFFWIAALSVFVIIGALYSFSFDKNFKGKFVPNGAKYNFRGLVVNNPVSKGNYQDLNVKTKLSGAEVIILAKVLRYPEYHYGDLLVLNGQIDKPEPEGYAQYLTKEGISGVMFNSELNLIASNQGSLLKSLLFKLKNSIVDDFGKFLPYKESAFLSGLVLGERSDFSEGFKTAMQTSGTTHLVALSGYNVTLIISAFMAIFLTFFRRKTSFFLAFIFLIAFVLMTGAEASVVRAAIMGALVVVAKESGRIWNPRNAITLAGLLMVLVNPKVLVFDAGFELSFLALVGIVYLRPAIQRYFRIKEEAGVFSWRDNLLTTGAAQLMVVPVLIQSFGSFSLISLVSNILILGLVPYTMILGFVSAVFSRISYCLTLVLNWFIWPFLRAETGIIEFFGRFGLSLNLSLSWVFILIYYSCLMFFIYRSNKIRTSQAL